MLNVAKFGGTSVADYDAMLRCANIIKDNQSTKVVVVSASAGVTNHLVTLSQQLLSHQEQQEIINQIRGIQYNITQQLAAELHLNRQIDEVLDHLTALVEQQNTLQTAKTTDSILACGERMSSILFAEVLRSIGVNGLTFDVRQVMRTNSLYGKAVVDIEALALNCEQQLLPLLQQHVIVTQGFIGQDGLGNTTTLGRGGSDYSAALLAEACQADDLLIWTDVVGIFTTDPRIASSARAIPEISFGEAAEMATFGAKILHPATLIPAMRSDIPVFVGSSREPQAGGTQIRQHVESKPTYRAIALRKEQTLVTVKSPAMLHASGFLAQVFAILAKHELSVDLITTSEISVALTFDNPTGSTQALINQQVLEELEQLCEVTVEHGLSLVAIVGNNLQSTTQLGSNVFNHIEDVSVRMICHGASANNLCFLVAENDANQVVETLHDKLFI
ncbi:lysine-sensitive aspartokinase 3 [Thalassotalea sp. HSM 43]|uniref:lysine-sensitive aspartokinase 3 n=1 Tax=Thalassotalea sp. HSM 43 TaxID=2552945 RepID=UPI001080C6E1|nr:lysine-sensitive aspartokinase 3 [Thalassotalea sp. HSM 43]QBY02898.1 lysine-sensitive aspartokinase 3 [Thalassotalea sp. HSM 43]